MNRFADPILTKVEGFWACTSPCCKTNGGTKVLVRDEAGYLRETHTQHLQIVAGAPNLSRLEKWIADGRPEIVPFPLPSAESRAA